MAVEHTVRKRDFTDHERYAVFTAHGEKCYMCAVPLDLLTMEVDHVIPEHLLDTPAELKSVLNRYGLPLAFDLQSYENWMPSCRPCNSRKRGSVFRATPAIQIELEKAAKKSERAADLAVKSVNRQRQSKSWNAIKRAFLAGELASSIEAEIRAWTNETKADREPDLIDKPVRLTPLLEVISTGNGRVLLRGPYGVGAAPADLSAAHSSWRCSVCGNSAWNGIRCVACGNVDED